VPTTEYIETSFTRHYEIRWGRVLLLCWTASVRGHSWPDSLVISLSKAGKVSVPTTEYIETGFSGKNSCLAGTINRALTVSQLQLPGLRTKHD
jgi:hypothetical protein